MGEKVLVSVNMIAYNASKYIAESIESVILQTFPHWELIVVDDGSTDDTLTIAKAYAAKDERVRVYSNGQNEGIVYTRNRALHYSSGKYVAVLDSDDIALPDRLEKQMNFMEQNPVYDLIGSAFYFIDSDGVEIGKGELNAKPSHFPAILMFDNFFLHSSVMMKTVLAKKYLYRPLLKGFSPCEEYHLYVDIAKDGKVWNLPDYLVKYREHGQGISKTRVDMIDYYRNSVILDQLKNLGVFPSNIELTLHKMSRAAYEGLDYVQVKEIKQWLELLVKKNSERKVYASGFDEYLARRFWDICKFNADKGLKIWLLFKFSRFSQLSEITLEEKRFLFNRCLYETKKNGF